ncbi:MAG: helicase-related protein [Candidatus Paceibacterota bacterium]
MNNGKNGKIISDLKKEDREIDIKTDDLVDITIDDDNVILASQIWNGPKIAKYSTKYLGVYDLQIDTEDQDDINFKEGQFNSQVIKNAFNEISRNLRYNEFRRLLWKGQTECYQFIKPLSNNQTKAYTKGTDTLKMSTFDILEYARSRMEKQTSQIVSGNQVKNRSVRESKWKKWYQKRLEEDANIESSKLNFLKEHVIPIKLRMESKLLDFQKDHVKILLGCLNRKGVALDASDTGTGKTYAALCLAKEMGLMPIIVCPKSIIPGWCRAMSHFQIDDYYVANYEQYRAGNSPYLIKKTAAFDLEKYKSDKSDKSDDESLSPISTSPLSTSPLSTSLSTSRNNTNSKRFGSGNKYENERNESISKRQQKEVASRVPKVEYEWKLDGKKHFLIFDECHKCKNTSTLNYAIFWWAKQKHINDGLKILCLSATVADKIANAYAICLMLGLISNHIHGINNPTDMKNYQSSLSSKNSAINEEDEDEFNNKFNNTYNVDLESGLLKDFGYEVTSKGFYKFNPRYLEIKERLQKEDTNLKKLHNDLFPMNGSRMVISDLGDAFPENFIQAQTYDMDRRTDQIQRIYHDMEVNLAKLQLKNLQDKKQELTKLESQDITELSEESLERLMMLRKTAKEVDEKIKNLLESKKFSNNKYNNKNNNNYNNNKDNNNNKNNKDNNNNKDNKDNNEEELDDLSKNHLAIMMKARQKVELLKADTMIELGCEFLDQGKSVVIFVNFIETLEYCHKEFQAKFKLENEKSGITIVRGGQNDRQTQIDLFQENKNRLALVTMGSGRESISLHDLSGNHPRVSLISPSFSAQDLIQSLGRIHRAEGKSKCLQYLIFCAGTIEDRICELVETKIQNINTINDGDLSAGLIINK